MAGTLGHTVQDDGGNGLEGDVLDNSNDGVEVKEWLQSCTSRGLGANIDVGGENAGLDGSLVSLVGSTMAQCKSTHSQLEMPGPRRGRWKSPTGKAFSSHKLPSP